MPEEGGGGCEGVLDGDRSWEVDALRRTAQIPPSPGLRDFKGRFRHDGVMRSDTSDPAVCGRSVWDCERSHGSAGLDQC